MLYLCRDCFLTFETHEKLPTASQCPKCSKRRLIGHAKLETLNIAHIDCDAFYASIHKRDDKSLMDKPIIIGGGKRGVVSTACYIARSFGVKSAMPMFMANKLCPNAIVIKPNMRLYSEVGKQVKSIFYDFTPIVNSVSIDEAYLDLSGTQKLHGAIAAQSLAKLALRIENEIGINVSIGLSQNRFLAKTASDMDKPRGFYALSQEDVPQILWPRDIGFLHGIGPASVKKLNALGFQTIGDLAKADERLLFKNLGPHANRYKAMALGHDNRAIESDSERKSISTETTFFDDVSDLEILKDTLRKLCETIARSARAKNLAGRTLSLKLKTAKFQSITRQVSFSTPTHTAKTIYNALLPLLENEIKRAPFRLIGAGLNELESGENADLGDLINIDAPKSLRLEKALDKIINKYGANIMGTRKS